jgi:hypothetical protein
VIRQASQSDPDEDAFVIVPRSHVEGLIAALQAEVKALAEEAEARNDL